MTFDGPTIHGSVSIVKGEGVSFEEVGFGVGSKERRKEASALSCFMYKDIVLGDARR